MDRNLKQEALPNAIFGHESRNWTSLHEAVAAGDDRRVQILLSSNVDRMAKESSQGNTPLHEAASRGFSRCVKLICAPLISKSQQKEKSRLKARVANTIEALHNSTLSIINNEGLTALHLAAQNGHNQSSRELLMAGADPDVQNKYGDTALHTACRYGHAGVTRILLSALCDPNKTNLNGDTALHITCAMGRRKLTRILLEADARLSLKNAQGDTPQSIAVRKNYREINEILSTPKRIRNRKERPKDVDKTAVAQDKDKDKDKDSVDKSINWSPYGCHYFPDPRSFPSPKLETLPKEPLKQGEQYFLDLAGRIHKGPVSVGNTCYCGPFFRHIENKLNCNRKSLKKYVHKTKERLGHKVQALAIKTNDQIEQLTRTMIEDRIRCESKRQYLNEYLRRGEPLRSTYDNQTKCQRIERTLSRCRSLDLLDSNIEAGKMSNSRSVDVLENGNTAVVQAVYHSHLNSKDEVAESDTNDESQSNLSVEGPPDCNDGMATALPAAQDGLKQTKLDELKLDFLKVSERLGDLLEKTTLLMERDNEQETKLQPCSLSPEQSNPSMYSPGIQGSLLETKESANSPNYDEYTNIQRRYPNSSETSNPSQNSNSWEYETSPPDAQKFYHCIGRGENMLNTVIKALRKDASFADSNKDDAALNENADKICGNKLMYKDQAHVHAHAHGHAHAHAQESPSSSKDLVFHGPQSHVAVHNSMSNLIKRQPLCLEDSFADSSTLYYNNPISIAQHEVHMRRQGANDVAGKVEIRNSEIKYLKKPNSGQVKDMIAQLQGKIDSNMEGEHIVHADVQNANICADHYNNRLQSMATQLPSPNPSSLYAAHMRGGSQQFGVAERQVPKDAYFHDLSNRTRNPQRPQHLYPDELANSRFLGSYPAQQVAHGPIAPLAAQRQPHDFEYISRTSHLANGNQAQSPSSIVAQPMLYRNRQPVDVLGDDVDLDVDEIAAVGLYNNVSSLV